ncbi:chromate resistance protein ChrB domain-containing protein [Thauera sp. 2A1]|uniref:chromate resistance protein ChrB domain-containing protein n=1 Tax=Thauera sp. 2A1 TaxID=2570191 RepID=UPI001D170356|nr:chromate resistance protein ChrB domain-containing protein [Thauera sp. 2A1]KAI5915185.1 chromate resistance protein [Thauera sp. 2A1]
MKRDMRAARWPIAVATLAAAFNATAAERGCGQPALAREAAGLLAISRGLSLNFTDDHEMLAHGMVIYDALYAWCADIPVEKMGRFLGLM